MTLRDRHDRLPEFTQHDPRWWCPPCEDGLHEEHTPAFRDPFGEWAGCTCPTCD